MVRIRVTCSALEAANWPGAIHKRVLEADADVGAHRRADGGQRHLVLTGAQDRPLVVLAEEPIGGAPHVHEVFGMAADSAEEPEHRLHEQRSAGQAAAVEVCEVVQV